jgi:type III secretion protein T
VTGAESTLDALRTVVGILLPNIYTWVDTVALHMIRIVVVLMILPLTADQIINNRARLGIAMLLAFFVAYGRPAGEIQALPSGMIIAIIVKEIIIGVALGFAISTVLWVVEYVGALIDNAAGYNSVQLQNPMSGEQATPVSDMLLRLAGAIFFAIGGGIFLTQTLFDSFQVWPVANVMPSGQGTYEVFIERQVGTLFSNMLKLAAPLLIILVLIDLGVSLLSRTADKLEPASLAQPIKGIVAILVLLLLVATVFDPLRQYLVPRGIVQQLMPDSATPGNTRPDSSPAAPSPTR